MALQELKKLDLATSDFKTLFSQINDNFDKLKDYLVTLGDKILTESFSNSTDSIITFSNIYTPGKHNLLVFYNGVIQWSPDNYEELSSNSIRLKFDRSVSDEIRIIIIRSNLIEQDLSGYLVQLTELVNSSKESLTEVRTALNRAELLNTSLTTKMQELSTIYEDIKRMYTELKS